MGSGLLDPKDEAAWTRAHDEFDLLQKATQSVIEDIDNGGAGNQGRHGSRRRLSHDVSMARRSGELDEEKIAKHFSELHSMMARLKEMVKKRKENKGKKIDGHPEWGKTPSVRSEVRGERQLEVGSLGLGEGRPYGMISGRVSSDAPDNRGSRSQRTGPQPTFPKTERRHPSWSSFLWLSLFAGIGGQSTQPPTNITTNSKRSASLKEILAAVSQTVTNAALTNSSVIRSIERAIVSLLKDSNIIQMLQDILFYVKQNNQSIYVLSENHDLPYRAGPAPPARGELRRAENRGEASAKPVNALWRAEVRDFSQAMRFPSGSRRISRPFNLFGAEASSRALRRGMTQWGLGGWILTIMIPAVFFGGYSQRFAKSLSPDKRIRRLRRAKRKTLPFLNPLGTRETSWPSFWRNEGMSVWRFSSMRKRSLPARGKGNKLFVLNPQDGIVNRRPNRFEAQRRETPKDFFRTHSAFEKLEHGGDGDAGPSEYGFPVANTGVHRNVLANLILHFLVPSVGKDNTKSQLGQFMLRAEVRGDKAGEESRLLRVDASVDWQNEFLR